MGTSYERAIHCLPFLIISMGLITSVPVQGPPDSRGHGSPATVPPAIRPLYYNFGGQTVIPLPQLPGNCIFLAVPWRSGAHNMLAVPQQHCHAYYKFQDRVQCHESSSFMKLLADMKQRGPYRHGVHAGGHNMHAPPIPARHVLHTCRAGTRCGGTAAVPFYGIHSCL